MKSMRALTMLLTLAALSSLPGAVAGAKSRPDANAARPPVYSGDVDRPYRVVGEIKDNLRKHFAFQDSPTKEKIYAELWERARKMGADAVIDARYGATEPTPFNHGRTPISGIAIKFTDKATDGGK